MPLKVIIAGAGIGGLTTAIALRQAGHDVILLEKQESKREVGYAVTIPPNSSRILRALGVDFVKTRMTPWDGIDMIRADKSPPEFGPKFHIDAEGLFGAPHLCTHRVDLWEELFGMATKEDIGNGATVSFRPGTQVNSYDPEAGSATLESGEVLKADLVVAADGVRSIAHKWVLGEERPATLSKLHSIRFVVPTKVLQDNPKTSKLDFGQTRARLYMGATNTKGIFQSPCRDNTLQNFGVYDIGSHNQTNETRWITKADRKMALAFLEEEGFVDDVLEVVRLADDEDMFLWRVADRDPLPKFTKSKLALLGDACHPMRPDHGQGASQAIEDAGMLGAVMAGAEKEDVEERLKIWEELRKPRAGAAQLVGRSDGMILDIKEGDVRKLKALLGENMPELTRPKINDWFFSYDCVEEAKKALGRHLETKEKA